MTVQASRAVEGLVKTTVFSHGAMEVRDLAASRRFYEELLGLSCVRHHPFAMMVRKGQYFSVVAVQVGDKAYPLHALNRWGVDAPSHADVDRAHALAHEHKERYGIRTIQHGAYSFYLEDRDSNWWEVQHVPDGFHDIKFAEGDISSA